MSDDVVTDVTDVTDVTGDEGVASPAMREVGLHRSNAKRVIAGVAGGIGERLDVDANIVRVAFILLVWVFGLGAAIYLAMWALVPRSSLGAPPTPEVPASTSKWSFYALMAGVLALTIIFFASIGGSPVPARAIGLAWVVFLVVLAICSLRTPARRLNLRRLVAIAFLMVVSVAILLSSAVVGFLASTGVPFRGGNGALNWQPSSLAAVRSSYRVEFGTATVDLSDVHFPVSGRRIEASVVAGQLVVVVPRDAVVDLVTRIGLGNVSYPELTGVNPGHFVSLPPTLTASAASSAPHVTIVAAVGIGHIRIQRATTAVIITPGSRGVNAG